MTVVSLFAVQVPIFDYKKKKKWNYYKIRLIYINHRGAT